MRSEDHQGDQGNQCDQGNQREQGGQGNFTKEIKGIN